MSHTAEVQTARAATSPNPPDSAHQPSQADSARVARITQPLAMLKLPRARRLPAQRTLDRGEGHPARPC
ncbi:MAG TPA: hypothetical protein VGJ44_01135 [Kribbellaceae bacterium]